MKSSPDTNKQQIRVLLADDHPVVRQGLATILKSQKDIKIVAEAADGEEVCALYDQLSPDVLLLDLQMPKKDGRQVCYRTNVAERFQTTDYRHDCLRDRSRHSAGPQGRSQSFPDQSGTSSTDPGSCT